MRPHSRLTAYQSKRFESQKKAKNYLKTFLIVLDIFLVIFTLSKLSYLQYIQIKDISVVGAKSEVSILIKTKIAEILDDSYLGLFSKANLFIYPKSQLTAVAQNIAPEIQSISVRRNGLLGLQINVVSKQASAIACTSLPEPSMLESVESFQSNSSNCYLVDWSGKIFGSASLATTSLAQTNVYFIPNLEDVSTSTEVLVNSYATSSSEFTALQTFYNQSREAGLEPHYILVKENGEYEMYAKDTIIYFNNQSPLQDQLQNLILFYNRMNSDGEKHFEYIDIRFGSNVFYRQI